MILKMWERFRKFPGGRFLFSKFIGKYIPYTGSIGAEVLELEPGHVKLELKDRRAIRNHLDSVHAVALMNLSELTTGLVVTASLPPKYRAILRHFSIEYLKKARGTLSSQASFKLPEKLSEKQDCEVSVEVSNAESIVVCRAKATWRVGPDTPRSGGGASS